MSYSREFLIKQFKKGVRAYMPIASAAETLINHKLSQLDEDDWARIEEFFNSFKFPLHVYRGLNVKSEKDVDFKNPGNNWTVDTALFHAPLSAFRNSTYILEGYIDEDQIDWPETVQNFMYYSVNAARNERYPENEVTLKKGQVPHDLTGSMKESINEATLDITNRLNKILDKIDPADYTPEDYEAVIYDRVANELRPEGYNNYAIQKVVDTYIAQKQERLQALTEVYPQKNESKSDFINRFMRVTAEEYPDVKQRYAVANSYWDKRSKNEAYLDPEEKFWDYRTKEVEPGQYIDTTRNEIRWVDDMLEDPDYYEQKKGYTGRIIEMSPEEYFKECAELFGNSIEAQKRQIAADTNVLDKLTQVIKKYHKRFPIPFINIKDRTQEGRHRMYVLGELFGWDKKVPVLIIQDVNNVRIPGKEIK